jgi:hypothetical protein
MDRLRVSLSIWDDILSSKDEIDGWSNNSLPQLTENISNLDNSLKVEEFLKEFEVMELYSSIEKNETLGEVAHAFNPSYSGGGGRRI